MHANSSAHYLKQRQAELANRLIEYKKEKVAVIYSAEKKQKPKLISTYREEVRAGVKVKFNFIITCII